MSSASSTMPVTSSDQISTSKIWGVILASSVGTMIEWYDFYIFGKSGSRVLSQKFYPQGNNTFALIAYLATFFVGFGVRPFGALFFGRIGDLVGRKYAFLVTLTVMGGGTFLIGCMPTFKTAGLVCSHRADRHPRVAGAGIRWGVWRGCDIRCRTRSRQQARILDQLYSDYRHAGLVLFLDYRDAAPVPYDVGKFPELRLAYSLPGFERPGYDLTVHSAQDEGIPHL